MRIDLLDVGETKYGDCILVRHEDKAILIDGAHPGDTDRIRTQLTQLFRHAPPFALDLLVVTHCHSDHIGCLPALVKEGALTVTHALVADEKLGWGRQADGAGPADALVLSDVQQLLLHALQEEDYSELPLADLQAFLQDAATLEQRYGEMLQQLTAQGTNVVRYGKAAETDVQALEAAFADVGLQVLGPTVEHLLICADAIAQGVDALGQAVQREVASDAIGNQLTDAYRSQVRETANAAFAADRAGLGAAKNNQSLVLKLEADGWRVLLAGDMQLAKAEVPNLTPYMRELRQRIVEAGPYDFIKLAHHSSYNAVDEALLAEWGATTLYAHTGGRQDASHPDEEVLLLLQSRREQLRFARTDRNGIITVDKDEVVAMRVARGRLNDFTVNKVPDAPAEPIPVVAYPAAAYQIPAALTPSPLPPSKGETKPISRDNVEVYARVPHQATKVTLTIQVEPTASEQSYQPELPIAVTDQPGLRLGGGRILPRLLFVTSRARLERAIGQRETAWVLQALEQQAAGQVVDLPAHVSTAEEAAALVRPRLVTGGFVGVVLVGGLDVVPAQQLDVLDAASRQAVERSGAAGQDADDFIVWSDDLYGDQDGDMLPELPVSRVPDGHQVGVLSAALQAPAFAPGPRFGIYNLHRPFARAVFPMLPGQANSLEVSEQCSPAHVQPQAAVGAVYYMLHGAEEDGRRFWGESQDGRAYEAIAVGNVPAVAAGTVVFTGCCWGALTMEPPAARLRPGNTLRPRGAEDSMALAYLRAGAVAFVGCTGSHYSPLAAPYNYFGKPLHDDFWRAMTQGQAPAQALFLAKQAFARALPHGQTDAFSRAVEMKILRQYTCLGLGW